MSRPARLRNSAINRLLTLPGPPPAAYESLPGCDFTCATNSWTVLAGKPPLTISTCGLVPITLTGAKSFSVS